MAYTTPRTWIAGEVLTAAQLNVDVRDNVSFLANPPACRVYEADTAQTLNYNTATAITFDSEAYDTDSMHSTSSNTSRVTFNTAGLYDVFGAVALSGETDYVSVVVGIRLNGTTTIGQSRLLTDGSYSASQPNFEVQTTYKFAAADYVELVVTQENTSGNAEATVVTSNLAPVFGATWVGIG